MYVNLVMNQKYLKFFIYSADYELTRGEFSIDFLFLRWNNQGIVTVLRNADVSFTVQITQPPSGS